MWDIIYAVDASSSMADSHRSTTGSSFVKIDLVRKAIADLLGGGIIPYGSRLGVFTFNAPTRAGGMFLKGGEEMTKTIVPLTKIDGLTKDGVAEKLAAIQVAGATPTGLAIEEGLKQLYAADDGTLRRIKKLVMITDEKSNVGPRPERVVDEEAAGKAIIDVIAIGGKINREALEKLTAKTGGKFFVVESAEDLLGAMKPRMEVKGLGVDAALLDEVSKSERGLQAARPLGTASIEYKQALEKARQVRAKANKRLMEVLIMKGRSEGEVRELLAQVQKGMPMHEYAEKVWPRASELDQVEKVERELRGAMDKLAA